MNHVLRLGALSLAALAAARSAAVAAPARNVCVSVAFGVPSRGGPPQWLDWGSGTPVDDSLDDPRWLGATGHSFHLGSARAPLLSRALWANGPSITGAGTQDFLYLSFIVDLEGLSNAGAATPRDLFVGFRRPSTFAGPDGNENAYIFQFHLTTGSSASLVTPSHCAAFSSCDESSGSPHDFWRAFVDRGASGTCGGASGEKFERMLDSGGGAPITWMTGAPHGDAVRFWKLDASQAPLLVNRWAVQLRIPIAANDTSPLSAGIPRSSTFWYQGSAALTTTPVQLYAPVGWWPRELTQPVCPATAIQDFVVHPELGTADKWSSITRFAGPPRPSGCDSGLTIETENIGSEFNAAPGTDFAAVTPPGRVFKPNGVNTVIAQVVNLTPTEVKAPMVARFRLAEWGSAPWLTPTEHGAWKDMRGAGSGVCGTGLAPNCICQSGTPPGCPAPPEFKVPALVDIVSPFDGKPDPGTNNRAAFTFQWTIGNDPTLGASEYCKFGLKPPDVGATVGQCVPCDCSVAPNQCNLSTDTGTRANVGAATPCVSSRISHECMFVELSAPNGGVDFVQQSSWNNMDFDQMSVVSREALIDARQLPKAPGQTEQDIYMVVMPRNMPSAISGGPVSGVGFVRERALERAEKVAAPYVQDVKIQSPAQIQELIKRFGRQVNGETMVARSVVTKGQDDPPDLRERLARLARALDIMPEDDFNRVGGLIKIAVATNVSSADLNTAVFKQVGPAEAAGVVPTLEIYPFYQPLGRGTSYLPMTAFTVFLSHEGAMTGMNWVVDGATRVGQNVYHLRIPVGFARRIRVRAEAIEAQGALGPGNPAWPCAGGCAACGGVNRSCGLVAALGSGGPGLLACVWLIGRRRKQPKRQA